VSTPKSKSKSSKSESRRGGAACRYREGVMSDMDIRTLDAILRPRSIAVVGASRTPGTIGYQVVANLVRHGYTGVVYPVNPKANSIHSIPAYASVADIPGSVDMAVVVVPKEYVLDVADQCGAKGVKGLVVISAGFREVGGAGVERERELLERVRRHGMRLVGPNCMGVMSTSPELSMNATFAPSMPPAGPVSLMSQSGAMGVTILDYASEYGIGINDFVSVGNKPDVSGNDLVQYWADDERTSVILMYLENFGNPRRFTPLARKITKKKPIIVVKAGRTGAGARAATSHTGALAGLDVATEALLAQCGVIRVDTVEELFDMAMAFGTLAVPGGNRVAIVTNAGGPGIIIADACEGRGLEVVQLSDETQASLREVLAAEASVRNPVDMIASATPESYRLALDRVLADENVDAAIAAFVPPLGIRQEEVAQAIVAAKQNHQKPVLAVLMGREGLPAGRAQLNEAGVPAYIFPESAARALAAMYRYRQWLARPDGTFHEFDVDRAAVRQVLDDAAARGVDHLAGPEALAVFRAYGIPVLESRVATTADEAAAAAEELGLPVVLKVESADVVHKTDVGGVVLNLATVEEVREEFDAMVARVRSRLPDARLDGVLVQPFVAGGRETIIGGTTDPTFGPLLMFGLGGVYVEVLQDVIFRVHPISDVDAREMVRSIRGYKILEGFRGEPPADQEALVDVIQRVSQLMGENPEIEELDINPFLVRERGAVALDARVRIKA
jgi:acetate---CoA ligase (ADP-forming)